MFPRILVMTAMFAALLVCAKPGQAQKSESVVKVTAAATKIDDNGKQTITVTLKMDKGWHTYANPVDNESLENVQTVVTVTGKQKPQAVKVDYPPGKLVKDKFAGDHKVYEDKVEIKAFVTRAKGDTGPLEVTVVVQACTDKKCLQLSKIKLVVP